MQEHSAQGFVFYLRDFPIVMVRLPYAHGQWVQVNKRDLLNTLRGFNSTVFVTSENRADIIHIHSIHAGRISE